MSGLDISNITGKPVEENKNNQVSWLKKILSQEITIFSAQFGDKQKEEFYLEMATLLSSGVDLRSALQILEEEQTNQKFALTIQHVKDGLIKGLSLWEAMQMEGSFTSYEYFAIQIGEETGKIVAVLEQLHQYFTARLKQKRQLVNALSYPVIILLTSIGAVTFMLMFIVPMFSDVFKRFGGDLPVVTKLIIDMAAFFRSYFWLFALMAAVAISIIYRYRDTQFMKISLARLVKKIPVIGHIVYSMQTARFCTSMALLLGSKVPLIRSLELVRQMIEFYPIQVTLGPIAEDIMNGNFLHVSMSRHPVYGKKLLSLIKIGEEVNKLDLFFDKLAKQFSSEAEHQMGLLSTFLEPLMIIFLGIIVGVILLAMYLPMFQISTTVGA